MLGDDNRIGTDVTENSVIAIRSFASALVRQIGSCFELFDIEGYTNTYT